MDAREIDTNEFAQEPSEQLLELPAVIKATGIKKTKIYEGIKEGTFPAPAKVGRASRWPASEVQAWVREQKNARTTAAPRERPLRYNRSVQHA